MSAQPLGEVHAPAACALVFQRAFRTDRPAEMVARGGDVRGVVAAAAAVAAALIVM